MPTKEELRRQYGISNQDFAVLTQSEMPTGEELGKEGAYIEKAGWWEKFEVWLKRGIPGGVVLAIIFIG